MNKQQTHAYTNQEMKNFWGTFSNFFRNSLIHSDLTNLVLLTIIAKKNNLMFPYVYFLPR